MVTAIGAISLLLGVNAIRAAGDVRTISIYNIHTKETVNATFKRDGEWVEEGLRQVNHIMRDWRIDEAIEMDRKLVDLLWELHTELGAEKPIHLISGHRSQQTNDMLRRTRGGQATRSLHITGLAADVYFPDVPLERLRNAALVRERGGVGYYPRSGQPFVHVDTGRVRHWPSIPESEFASIMNNRDRWYGSGNSSTRPAAPTTQVADLASQIFETPAPPPRLKPAQDDAVAVPIVVASAANAGESALEPSRRTPGDAGNVITSAGRDWGQSWLLPTMAPGSPPVAPVSGAARVVASAAPAKSDAPFNANIAAGYAAPVAEDRRSRIAGLLDGSTDDLASLLAQAELLQEPADERYANDGNSGPVDLRPAVLIHSSAEAPSRPRNLPPVPVMTASLGPAAAGSLGEPRSAFAARREARVPAYVYSHPHGPAPALEPGPRLVAALLTGPAHDHVAVLRPGAVDDQKGIVAFAAAGGAAEWMAPGNGFAVASNDAGGDLFSFAERALGWLFGN